MRCRGRLLTRLHDVARNADIEPVGPFVARASTVGSWAFRGVYGTRRVDARRLCDIRKRIRQLDVLFHQNRDKTGPVRGGGSRLC